MWGAQPKPVDRYSVEEYEFFHALSEYFR
jgi:hypothetical protein